ncbi:MAG: glycoside hydrolase family 3 C-terminal domain-containing protein [Oscillospiraceae bacterium]|nr:glycoside hydrolase family 3 C-terminal domain-containing protein [Oscillospiraceae bacterium]
MTLEDKISLCTGRDFWHTKAMPQYGIPDIKMSDGPHGLRCQRDSADMLGINESMPATCFPTAVTAGATWNRALYAAEGEAIAKEGSAAGVSVVLGPGCNIKRNPLGGRNFEYISEDPYFAGKMAASFIGGMQSTGVAASVKHFAVNSQEYKRQNGDSQLDDRTLREIYLTPFEIAVKESKPGTVMCSYNKINGTHASDCKELLTDILRSEWGFDGLVVSDWGALNDRIEAYKAGCDLNMPGGSKYMEKETAEAVRKGLLDEADIDNAVERILRLVARGQDIPKAEIDWDAHHDLALKIAEQGAVLLKNEDQILPLRENDMVLIGHMAANLRYQGSGSSHINPTKQVNLTDAMPGVPCCACGDGLGNVSERDLREAAAAAKKGKTAVVVVGLPDSYESEAFDREHMRLPDGHNALVEAVVKANPNTVVVLLGGSAMECPWADQVKAILYLGLPGQAGGQAAANLLTGKAVPSGKLTESWPMCYEDVISRDTFGKKNTEYREGIYVGYRYYDKAEKAVRYPFGHGLSYTRFDYSDLQVTDRKVSVRIQNTGAVAGAEVVQLYIAAPQSGLFRPVRELKGFARVELEPGETKIVEFELDDRSFAIWADGWKIPGGTYKIQIGASSRDIRLEREIEITGEAVPAPAWQMGSWYDNLAGKPSREAWEKLMGHSVPVVPEPKKGQFTMDSTCMEMLDSSLVMKIQYKITEHIIAKSFGGKKDLSDPAYRMMITSAVDCPMRSVVINGCGMMSDSLARGLLQMANGHYIKGILRMLKK